MAETKHAPGPWSLEFDDVPYDGGFETMVINSENGGICMMDCPRDEMDANGRLIAAAPDLLSVAEGVRAALSYPRGSEAQVRCLEEVGQDAEYAIKKATEAK